eukprot:TRINITY_DN27788_c0_g1_i1.p1 TRINITY_DN27788_c0_g1~~TRINITY_DN27788_c0_g1_i1.p1  ORF type:complete len:458 (-),score=88.90 TRINITY_DN27788_c0_g1_i1:545-1918(-)
MSEDENVLQDFPLPEVKVVTKVSPKADFPSRVGSTGDRFEGEGVCLRPHKCDLGEAGSFPCAKRAGASGVWRGSIEASDSRPGAAAATSRLAPLLVEAVGLDGCGTLVEVGLSASSLRFLPSSGDEKDELSKATSTVEAVFDSKKISAFHLAGLHGQVLTHAADLWLCETSEGKFESLLRLRPLNHAPPGQSSRMSILRPGPVADMKEAWCEVPMIELPRLFRIMTCGDASAGTLAKNDSERYLVEEDEEILVINAWRRESPEEAAPLTTDSLSSEGFLWFDTIRALAETAPCSEAAVPAARLRLSDEGIVTWEDILEGPEHEGAGVPEEDAPRLASLAFLKQYADRGVLEEEVLPRLLPEKNGIVRVFSASLANVDKSSPTLTAPRAARPKTIDEIFNDEADFRKPPRWASSDDAGLPQAEDPLARHELTSVLLFSEKSGFLLAFHCLQAIDPCAM